MAALILIASGSASAQLLQGTIDGNVTDVSNAAIAQVKVMATNQDTNFSRETATEFIRRIQSYGPSSRSVCTHD
jgi:hypothetical protein